MNVKEGKCNPDLFFLLLQKDVRIFLENHITIPEKYKERGFYKINIGFYQGSTCNLNLESVNIRIETKIAQSIMFSISKDGSYRNNSLIDKDLELVINLANTMDDKGTYFTDKVRSNNKFFLLNDFSKLTIRKNI